VRLYNNRASGNCWKVRQIAAHLGTELELVELDVVDRSDRPEVIGELNPALRVPTLVLDDGRALPESSAILWWFAEGTEYLPDDRYDRARVLGWMTFEQYEIESNLAVRRFWNLFGIEASDEQRELRRQGGEKALQALERGLADRAWLVGGTYTIADISLYGYTHVAGEAGFDLSTYPSIRAWLERVAAQPGHITIDA
jgi:glutathione S-transferase